MHIVRGIYLYVISLISLWVLAAGLAGVMALALEGIGFSTELPIIAGRPDTVVEELSRSLALAGVGLPLWTIHWWLVERGADALPMEHERVFRGLYLAIVLLLATVVSLTSAVDVVADLLATALGAADRDEPGRADGLAWLSVALAIWAYHARLLLRDDLIWRRRATPQSGASS